MNKLCNLMVFVVQNTTSPRSAVRFSASLECDPFVSLRRFFPAMWLHLWFVNSKRESTSFVHKNNVRVHFETSKTAAEKSVRIILPPTSLQLWRVSLFTGIFDR